MRRDRITGGFVPMLGFAVIVHTLLSFSATGEQGGRRATSDTKAKDGILSHNPPLSRAKRANDSRDEVLATIFTLRALRERETDLAIEMLEVHLDSKIDQMNIQKDSNKEADIGMWRIIKEYRIQYPRRKEALIGNGVIRNELDKLRLRAADILEKTDLGNGEKDHALRTRKQGARKTATASNDSNVPEGGKKWEVWLIVNTFDGYSLFAKIDNSGAIRFDHSGILATSLDPPGPNDPKTIREPIVFKEAPGTLSNAKKVQLHDAAMSVIRDFAIKRKDIKRSFKERLYSKQYTYDITLKVHVGNQKLSVADAMIRSLDERPGLKKVLHLVNEVLPKQYRIRTDKDPANPMRDVNIFRGKTNK